MTENAGLKQAIKDAKGATKQAWDDARRRNEETRHADETHRQITTLTSAALDALTRAEKLASTL